jgi:predicted SnoaL-like aldol condensation-catalyzing enzyme
MSEQNKRVVRRFLTEVCNKGNIALIDELFACDWVGHAPPKELSGPAELKQFVAAQRRAFPDLDVKVEYQIAEGDKVTFALGWTGYSLYATVVIAIPFRRGERWAWYTCWILVIGFAIPILISQESYVVAYLISAGVMALCLLRTGPAFFRKET